MPSTADVLDQHLRCFGENDLDGVVADYSSDAVLFVPDRPLKGPAAIKPFFQAFFAEFAKPGASFSMRQRYVEGEYATYCGARKPQTIRTKLLPTLSSSGTGRSWHSLLLPRLPRSFERVGQHAAKRAGEKRCGRCCIRKQATAIENRTVDQFRRGGKTNVSYSTRADRRKLEADRQDGDW